MSPAANGRIRLLLVTGDFQVGGTQRHLVALAQGLDRARFDVSVACLSTEGAFYETVRGAGPAGTPVTCFPIRHRLADPRSLAAIARLARFLRSRFDVVHTLLGHANVVGLLACALARHPGALASQRNLHPLYRSLRSGSPHLGALADFLFRRVARGVIANNPAIVESLRARGVPAGRILLVPNGIDTSRFRPLTGRDPAREAERLPPGAAVVGFVGRMIPDKGLGRVLDALPGVADGANRPHLLAVGDGPERSGYEAEAARRGIPARFTGVREDVERLLPLMDVLAFPSTYSEGTPNVVLEAMACAVPPIVHRMPQTEHLVEDGRTGLLIDATAPGALADALGELLGDPAGRRTIGDAGRNHVLAAHSLETMLRSLERVYEDARTPR